MDFYDSLTPDLGAWIEVEEAYEREVRRREPEWWAEWRIENVLLWYEFGDTGGFTVYQEQGELPRVTWSPRPRGRKRYRYPLYQEG